MCMYVFVLPSKICELEKKCFHKELCPFFQGIKLYKRQFSEQNASYIFKTRSLCCRHITVLSQYGDSH